jgi:hypothetical protein
MNNNNLTEVSILNVSSLIDLTGGWIDNLHNISNTFFVDKSNSRVGIGTTPTTTLDVAGQIRGTNGLTITTGTVSLPNDQIDSSEVSFNYAAAGSKGGDATGLACTDCVDGSDLADSITLDADLNIDSNTLYIDYTNNEVGIGTNTPDRKVEIIDASNPQLRLTQSDGVDYADLQTDSTGELTITTTGTYINLRDDSGDAYVDVIGGAASSSGVLRLFYGNSDTGNNLYLYQNSTDGNIFTTFGDIELNPAGGDVVIATSDNILITTVPSTGGNAGTDLCIDANGRLCQCGACA